MGELNVLQALPYEEFNPVVCFEDKRFHALVIIALKLVRAKNESTTLEYLNQNIISDDVGAHVPIKSFVHKYFDLTKQMVVLHSWLKLVSDRPINSWRQGSSKFGRTRHLRVNLSILSCYP
jgi:hypothetical protein